MLLGVFKASKVMPPSYTRSFKLGSLYEEKNYPYRLVRFIKVTRKGYNLLDIKTNKCILSHHLYSKEFAHKDIPEDAIHIKSVWVRDVPYMCSKCGFKRIAKPRSRRR